MLNIKCFYLDSELKCTQWLILDKKYSKMKVYMNKNVVPDEENKHYIENNL